MTERVAEEVALARGFKWDETLGVLAGLAQAAPGLALALAKVLRAFPDHTKADKLGRLIEAFIVAFEAR